MFLILTIKLFYIQFHMTSKLSNLIENLSTIDIKIKGDRGTIADRNGEIIAGNIQKLTFYVNTEDWLCYYRGNNFKYNDLNKEFCENNKKTSWQKNKIEKEKIASFLSSITDQDSSYYINKIENSKNKKYLMLADNIPRASIYNLKESISKINGLNVSSDNKRFYPYDDLCAQTIGYVDIEKNGRNGIEQKFNNILKGETQNAKYFKNPNGKKGKEKEIFNKNELKGSNIELTIDIEIQKILQNQLSQGLEKSGGKSANGIIMDPFTGEILAMATVPSYNPNNYKLFGQNTFINNVISKQYEPGSTYKAVTLAAALLEGYDIHNTIFNCENGSYKLPGTKRKLKDHEEHAELSIEEIIVHSSNIGVAKLVSGITDERLFSIAKKFGVGASTGITLPNESKGKIRDVKNWSMTSKPIISIGQEFSLTNLQLALIYSAIANNGYLLKPHIIKKINNKEDAYDYAMDVQVVRKIIDKNLSKKIIETLGKAVYEGTGTNAYFENNQYCVAGKTGTAEKFIDGKYSKNDFISSFASIFPCEGPEYVCIVSIDSPEKNKMWGNLSAAPIVKEIFKRIATDIDTEKINIPGNNFASYN